MKQEPCEAERFTASNVDGLAERYSNNAQQQHILLQKRHESVFVFGSLQQTTTGWRQPNGHRDVTGGSNVEPTVLFAVNFDGSAAPCFLADESTASPMTRSVDKLQYYLGRGACCLFDLTIDRNDFDVGIAHL